MEKLRELRQQRQMTQADLAKVFDTSTSTIGMYEQGRREPPIDLLLKFADYFNVSIDYLVGNQDTKKTTTESTLNEQDRQNEIARAFLKLILKDKPEAQAYIDRATVTASGRIVLPGIDEVDQRYLDKMQRSLIEALHDATDNGNGTKTVNLKLP